MRKSILFLFTVLVVLSCSSEEDSVPETKLTEPPKVKMGTSPGASGFTANWEPVEGAKYYKIDVSESPEFTSFVNGYNALEVKETTLPVTGINATQKTYYYRVRAGNGLGETDLSQIASSKAINKSLLYNHLWVCDTEKTNITFLVQDLWFESDGTYKSYFSGNLMFESTFTWKSDDTVSIIFGDSTAEIRFVDLGDSSYLAYFSTQIPGLAYFFAE